MQLPERMTELAFPAQRYARRRRQNFIDERRRRHHLAQAKQVSADDAGKPARDEESLRARRQAAVDRITNIATDQDELLHAKAEQLLRTGSVGIQTATGELSARLVRFRWGKDVLDISRSRGGQPTGWSLGTVPRSPSQARMEAITFELAKAIAIAALQPLSPSG